MMMKQRKTTIRRGEVLEIRTGAGAGALVLVLERYESGALELVDARAGKILRQWTPKEVKNA